MITALFKAPAPFQQLDMGVYELGDIDPPWPNANRSPKGEKKSSVAIYGKMSFEAIAALPVADLLAEDALVRVWTTWPLLLDGGDIKRHYAGFNAGRSPPGECIHAWGLRYVTGGAWFKRTITGKAAYGPGYRVRSACEPFLLCVKGSPQTARGLRNAIEGLRRQHSRKPEEGKVWLEQLHPNARRRVELFSRESRPGWDTWGYEAGKFDPVVTLAEAA